jgi:hypothetical protein
LPVYFKSGNFPCFQQGDGKYSLRILALFLELEGSVTMTNIMKHIIINWEKEKRE